MACPTWKNYVNTEEACDLLISDGSIYFALGMDHFNTMSTYDAHVIYEHGVGIAPEIEVADFDGAIEFRTNLPNPELGEWRYELEGTFTPHGEYETLADCFTIALDGTIEDGFVWNCAVVFPTWSVETYYLLECGAGPPPSVGYTVSLLFYSISGTLRIYYDWNGAEYGPITIQANLTTYEEFWCF